MLISDAGYNPYRVMSATRVYAAPHPQHVAAFVRASIQGWRDDIQDPTETDAAIPKLNSALDADWMKFTAQALRDGKFVTGAKVSGEQIGKMSADRWDTNVQATRRFEGD